MVVKAGLVWGVGLVTAVPYAAWYLLFRAEREQYAALISFVLFWIFGYWSIVGPLIAIVKVRRVFRTLEQAQSKGELADALRSDETKEVAIDLIATENHIPRFLAARVYRLLRRGLEARAAQRT